MSRKIVGALVAGVLGAAMLLLAGCGGGEDAEQAAAASEPEVKTALVRTVLPQREDVVDLMTLPADLLPDRRAVLAAEVAGVIERLVVDAGQRVGAGAAVATIDTRSLQQAVAEAEAYQRQAGAQAERARRLYEKRAITQKQVLDAVTAEDVANAQLASARLQLSKSRVTAPWSGEISAQLAEVGDYVQPGQAIVELVDTSRLKVRSPAPANDVPYLSVGAPVVIRVDALPGESFAGRVVRLGAELDAASRTLVVEAELANPGGRLKPGMLARMEVPRRTLEGAVLVPLEAVVDLGEQRAVFVVTGGRAERRIVDLGPVIGERVVVLAGVAAGEPVIVDGEEAVADGQPVEEAESGGAAAAARAAEAGTATAGAGEDAE